MGAHLETRNRQKGVALAIVLWFLAGMSLLVSGITYLARTDTQMTQLHRDRAVAVAAGDGAIRLMLAGFTSRDTRGRSEDTQPLQGEFTVGPHAVSVVMVPTTGLINLNNAPAPLLARLFAGTGEVSAGDATELAERVVLWREGSGPDTFMAAVGRFRSPEDLLQVPGVSRSLWDAVRDYVAVQGGFEEDPPVAAERGEGEFGLGPVGAQALTANESTRSFRMDAFVNSGGRLWLRRSWANLGSVPDSPLPWGISRVEAPRVVGAEQRG